MKNTFSYIILLIVLWGGFAAAQDLPPFHLDFASQVVTAEGRVLGYIGDKARVDLRSTGYVSPWVIWCLISTEDRDFYNHDGVSYKGLIRGIFKTITGSKQGGSTLTMQLVKNLYLSNEQTLSRKLDQIELAKEFEKHYNKDQILLIYLNTVYFGRGVYGIAAAAEEYFGKPADKLTVPESAALVGMLKNPVGYDPTNHADKMLSRRNEVLHNLVETGKITESEFQRYKSMPLGLNLNFKGGKYFIEQVRKEAFDILRPFGKSLNRDEIIIYTTCGYEAQKAADNAVKAQFGSGRSPQVGLVSVENGTGMIRALVGGNAATDPHGINRAMQIKRQPGSAFKPFLYASLLRNGYTLATPLPDSAIVVDSGKVTEWRPVNSEESDQDGNLPLFTAVQHSINRCAAYAITKLSAPDSVVAMAHQLGIHSEIPAYPSIALGTAEVSPLEMVSAYAVFATEGTYAVPYTITKIADKNGRVYYTHSPQTSVVLDSATAYLMTQAMKTVVDSGTATAVRKFYRGYAAGKTGTTQNSTDAWFVGYNKQLTTAIWVGYDNPAQKLGGGMHYGGTACAPVWGRMMGALAGKGKAFTAEGQTRPSNVQYRELCLDSGLLACKNCRHRKTMPVNTDLPLAQCNLHCQEK